MTSGKAGSPSAIQPDPSLVDSPWQWWRDQMPIARQWAYFDHAAVAPLSGPAAEAIREFASQAANSGDTVWPQWAALPRAEVFWHDSFFERELEVSASFGLNYRDAMLTAPAPGSGSQNPVLVPSYTFLATASCVIHQMAIPVFVDIEPKTYTMDPAKIEAAITDRTRAIVPVHLYGQPADMDPIVEIAAQHNLMIID